MPPLVIVLFIPLFSPSDSHYKEYWFNGLEDLFHPQEYLFDGSKDFFHLSEYLFNDILDLFSHIFRFGGYIFHQKGYSEGHFRHIEGVHHLSKG